MLEKIRSNFALEQHSRRLLHIGLELHKQFDQDQAAAINVSLVGQSTAAVQGFGSGVPGRSLTRPNLATKENRFFVRVPTKT